MSGKSSTFIVLKYKYLNTLTMYKDTTNSSDMQENKSFSLSKARFSKSLNVDFDAPDISSNGGLMLCNMRGSLAAKIGKALPDSRQKAFVDHPYEEMVCQRVGTTNSTIRPSRGSIASVSLRRSSTTATERMYVSS